METLLRKQIANVRRCLQNSRWALWMLCLWLSLLLVGLYVRQVNLEIANPLLIILALGIVIGLGIAIAFFISRLSYRNVQGIAKRIEARYPSLQQRLLTLLDNKEDPSSLAADYFHQNLLRETLEHASSHDWRDAAPTAWRNQIWFAQAVVFGLSLLVWTSIVIGSSNQTLSTKDSVALGSNELSVSVEPGNVDVEKGTNVVFTARFSQTVPDEVFLEYKKEGDNIAVSQPLRRNLKDPVFGGVLLAVDLPIDYRITYLGGGSESFQLKIFEYPAIIRSDAKIVTPAYAGADEKTIEDTRRVTIPEGAKVTWFLHLNKAVATVQLVDTEGNMLDCKPTSDKPTLYSIEIQPKKSDTWKVKLVDSEARENKVIEELVVKVIPNQPPSIKLAKATDLSVSPLEEVEIGAKLNDDFGVKQVGLSYSIDGGEPVDILLNSNPEASKKIETNHLLALEQLEAKPDQLISYYVWAEDEDATGSTRRVESDLFFAEVRPFEEIFREGESQSAESQQSQQQQSGAAQQAEELAELQKQIIVSLWNILRREEGEQRTATFADDLKVVRESQQSALEKLAEVGQQATAQEAPEIIERVRNHMENVLKYTQEGAEQLQIDSVKNARVAAQSAYAGLLQLRAREHEVTRSNQQQQQQSSSSSAQRSRQQQIDELELKNDPNRYETQQAPQQPQNGEEEQQAQEVRQAINRLKELARRQEDINKELQKLQAELQAAESAEKKQELEEQLSRLRDAQEELLRDTDELAERLSEESKAESLEQTRQQLEQTRENIQQAAESLTNQDSNRALSAGARAERELEDMRDQLRKESASQFTDQMKQMVEEARQLNEKQADISQRAQRELSAEENTGLRNETPESELPGELKQQAEQLNRLLDQMQETVTEAENNEPLLADKLYDAFRETKQKGLDQNLSQLSRLAEQGIEIGRTPETQQVLQQTDQGIDKLRQQVETAAEAVLGSETDALRRALSDLNQASDEINQELRRAGEADGTEVGSERNNERTDTDALQGTGERSLASELGQNSSSNEPNPSSNRTDDLSGDRQIAENDLNSRGQGESEQEASANPSESEMSQSRSARGDSEKDQTSQADRNMEAESDVGAPEARPTPNNQQPTSADERSQADGNNQSNENMPSNETQRNRSGQPAGNAPPDSRGGNQPSTEQSSTESRERDGSEQAAERGSPPQGNRRGPGTGVGFEEIFGGSDGLEAAPITGDDFSRWSDRLRDIEESLDDPQLQAEAARIREAARDIRREARKHAAEPQWDLVKKLVADPLSQLRQKVSEELIRKAADRNSVVPIDRDPVPSEFEKAQQKYYENLGSGK